MTRPRDKRGRFVKTAGDGPPAEKASVLHRPLSRVHPGPVSSDYRLTRYVKALEVSVWAFAAIMRLSQALAQTEFRLINRRTKRQRRDRVAMEVQDILDKVNPEETFFDYMEWSFVHYSISGEDFTEKARDRTGKVQELYHLPPESMEVIPGAQRLIEAYYLHLGAERRKIPREDVIFSKLPNPAKPYRGVSPIASLANSIGADSQAALYNLKLLMNGARVGGILMPEDGDIDDGTAEGIEADINARYRGAMNPGRTLVLPMGFKFERDAQTLRDMDFLNLRKFVREEVAAAIGVPPMLVQNFESATYANSEQQLKAFWDYIGKPYLRRKYGALNEFWIHPEVDPDLSIVADVVGIDAMVDSEDSRVNNATRLVSGGLILVNEGREKVGMGPLPGGDVLLVPLNLIPMAPAELEAPPEEPSTPPPPAGGEAPAGGEGGGDDQAPSPPARAVRLNGSLAKKARERVRVIARRAQLRDLREAEGQLRSSAKTYLEGMARRILAEVRRAFEAEPGVMPEPAALVPAEGERLRIFEAMAPGFLQVIRDQGMRTLKRLGFERTAHGWIQRADFPVALPFDSLRLRAVAAAFDLTNPWIRELLEEDFFRQIVTVQGTALEQVKRIVISGLDQGWGVSELQGALKTHFFRMGPYWTERIARTEAIGAVNMGTLAGQMAAGVPRRSWISMGGGDTRQSHLDMDAHEPVATDGFFHMVDERGEADLRAPGDPAGPGWACINCQCGTMPEGEEGVDLTLAWAIECTKDLEPEPVPVEARREELLRHLEGVQ